VLQAHADAAGKISWMVSVDSTISHAYQHAAGARRDGDGQKQPPGGIGTEPDDHGLGRSRGGWTTKTHLACEQGRKVLAVVVTGGQRGDSPQFIPVLGRIRVARVGGGRPRTRPDRVLADKTCTSRANRSYLRRRGIAACIPSKADQDARRRAKGSKGGRPPAFDPVFCRQRHAAECGISQLKQHRAIATRYEKLAVRYEATITIAAINQWLRALRNTA
jgi:transposase